MTFFNSGSILDVFGFIGICGICIGFLCFAYRILYGLFCYNNSIKIFNTNQEDRNDPNDDVIISVTNITPFSNVSCINIQEDTIIDNEKNLPIATIV